MTKGLHLAEGLTLPLEVVGEANAVIGKRNSGKTYTAKRLVEEMLRAKQQVIVCEPTDVWWGLRSSADSKGPGFPIAVFGGPHADLPLEPGSGSYMADLLVGEALSAVLCLKPFSKTQRRTFMADFAERLLQTVDHLMHVVLEEAHEWIPQRSSGETARMLGACSDLTTTGRTSGIGTTIVSQRPARLHKDPYEQTDNLIVHQLVGTNDRKAAEGWVKAQDLSDEAREMLDALPKLPQGTAYCYAPALLGEPRRMQVLPLTTFDSSATPKPGQQRREPKGVADIDLAAVREAMGEAIERAEANDPKVLRRRLAEAKRDHLTEKAGLLKQLEGLQGIIAEMDQRPAEPIRVDVPIINDDTAEKLRAATDDLQHAVGLVVSAASDMGVARNRAEQMLADFTDTIGAAPKQPTGIAPASGVRSATEMAPASRRAEVGPQRAEAEGGGSSDVASRPLSSAEEKFLQVLAQFEEGRSKTQLAILTGYSIKSSTIKNTIGSLRSRGYATQGEPILITGAGRAAIGPVDPLPMGEELLRFWESKLTKAEATMLRLIVENERRAGRPLSKGQIAELTGYSETSSTIKNALGRLRTLQLIRGTEPADELL